MVIRYTEDLSKHRTLIAMFLASLEQALVHQHTALMECSIEVQLLVELDADLCLESEQR